MLFGLLLDVSVEVFYKIHFICAGGSGLVAHLMSVYMSSILRDKTLVSMELETLAIIKTLSLIPVSIQGNDVAQTRSNGRNVFSNESKEKTH